MSLLNIALREYGVTEIPGKNDNPRILQYFHEIGQKWVKDDETAWCSAFINWCAKVSGLEYTGKLNARSWLDIGYEVFTSQPGDIVIFWRVSKEDWRGHVGLFINYEGDYINVLGGNQGNKVCIKKYHKDRLLGFRKLRNGEEN